VGTLMELGNLAIDEHKLNEARDALAEGLQLAHELGDWPGTVAGLEGFARLALALEQPLVAARLSAAAGAIRRQRGLRGRAAVDTLGSKGSEMSVEQAIEVALSL